MNLTVRNGVFHLFRRVPREYQDVEKRKWISKSFRTDSERIAKQKAEQFWDQMLRSWEARKAGDTSEADKRYETARELARAKGFTYLPIERVVQLPVDEILARLSAAHDAKGRPNMSDARALLGTVEKPTMTVSAALDLFWTLAKDRLIGKSKDQIRRWENPRKKAVRNFLKVVDDLDIGLITADHMLEFREWLVDRVEAGQVVASSANKDLIHFKDVINTVNKKKKLGLSLPFSDLMLQEGEPNQRPAFSTSWIQDELLAPGALAGMNKEARCLFLGMINTGYRPSEGAILTRDQIILDHDIPHISIEPVGRTLKTSTARRTIPLLGVSLEAFKECPDGFPRYREYANASSTINKFLAENGLRETENHTCYGIRHSFQERMIEHGVDDRVRREIFAHALTEERYGEVKLNVKRDALMPVAL